MTAPVETAYIASDDLLGKETTDISLALQLIFSDAVSPTTIEDAMHWRHNIISPIRSGQASPTRLTLRSFAKLAEYAEALPANVKADVATVDVMTHLSDKDKALLTEDPLKQLNRAKQVLACPQLSVVTVERISGVSDTTIHKLRTGFSQIKNIHFSRLCEISNGVSQLPTDLQTAVKNVPLMA